MRINDSAPVGAPESVVYFRRFCEPRIDFLAYPEAARIAHAIALASGYHLPALRAAYCNWIKVAA